MASSKLSMDDYTKALSKASDKMNSVINGMTGDSNNKDGKKEKTLSQKLSDGFKNGRGSVVNQAKGNIFEFPVFVSSSVPLEYATATNSLLEQVYASYLQMAISINPVVDSEVARRGLQFSNFKADTNKYLEYTDMSYAHDACHATYIEDGYVFEFNMMTISDTDAQIINEHCDYEPLSEFNHYFQEANRPIEDFDEYTEEEDNYEDSDDGEGGKKRVKTGSTQRKTPSPVDRDKREADAELVVKKNRDYDEDRKRKHDQEDAAERRADAREQRDVAKDKRDQAKDKRDNERASEKHEWERASEERAQVRERREAKKDLRDKKKFEHDYDPKRLKRADERAEEKHAHDTKIKASQFIDESKIQKLNTMKPLMMTVNLGIMDKDGGISRPMEYIVGVKTHCRLVDADILPEVAEFPIKEMNKLSRKAKWRAGELKFFRDIVFNIKGKKQSAIDSRDPKRKWYRRLYDLAHMQGDATTATMIEGGKKGARPFNVFMNALRKKGRPTGIMPNVTMIISKSDVDNIKAQTKIDLLKGNTAKSFCSELFLIGLVVIDTDAESIKMMMPDLHNEYEVHSLASVNKQLATLDTAGTKTRDILKMLK